MSIYLNTYKNIYKNVYLYYIVPSAIGVGINVARCIDDIPQYKYTEISISTRLKFGLFGFSLIAIPGMIWPVTGLALPYTWTIMVDYAAEKLS